MKYLQVIRDHCLLYEIHNIRHVEKRLVNSTIDKKVGSDLYILLENTLHRKMMRQLFSKIYRHL